MNGEWAAGRESTNSHPLSWEEIPATPLKIYPEDSSASNRELQIPNPHSSSSFVARKKASLADAFDSPKVAIKGSVRSVISISHTSLSLVSDGYISESFKCSSPEGGPEKHRRATLASLELGRFPVDDYLSDSFKCSSAEGGPEKHRRASSASLQLGRLSVPVDGYLSDIFKCSSPEGGPEKHRRASSASTLQLGRFSVPVDGYLSDSFKCSSPEGGPEKHRRASSDNFQLGRFSVPADGYLSDSFKCSSPDGGPDKHRRASWASLPIDTFPALPRRQSEPVRTLDFDFDLPHFQRSCNTELGFSMGDPPRASNLEANKYRDFHNEVMFLRYLGIEDDDVAWDSDLTRTDGEGEKDATKGHMAASPTPSPEHVSHRRPRRQGHRSKAEDPNAERSPTENPSSPTNRVRPQWEWRTAELRWWVDSTRRWRGHPSDDRLQKPCRRKRVTRHASSETEASMTRASRTPRIKNRNTAKAQASSGSPPLKDGGNGAHQHTPETSRLTPSPTENLSQKIREKVMSLDCPPPPLY